MLQLQASHKELACEATCKHIEVELNISLGKSVRDVTNCISSGMNLVLCDHLAFITKIPTEFKGALRLISYPHIYAETQDKSE